MCLQLTYLKYKKLTQLPAKSKALLVAQLANGPCCVEDTSLKFHAIGSTPDCTSNGSKILQIGRFVVILVACEDKYATAVTHWHFVPLHMQILFIWVNVTKQASWHQCQDKVWLRLSFCGHMQSNCSWIWGGGYQAAVFINDSCWDKCLVAWWVCSSKIGELAGS